MKLKSLTIENFKGIKKFILDANGENICILGDNGTGKTTVADSVAWLFYDQDSQGSSLQPKPLSSIGEPERGVCSDVEAIFIYDNESEVTLKKTFKEKWTRVKGNAKKTLTGHSIKYYFNDLKNTISKKKYQEKVDGNVCPKHIVRLLTTINFFSEGVQKTKDIDDPNRWDWQKRRELVMSMIGNDTDDETILSNKKFKTIPKILSGGNPFEVKSAMRSEQKELNKKLDEIEIIIKHENKTLPDMTDISIDIADMEKEQKKLSKELADANEKKIRIENGGEIAEKTKELRMIETNLLKIENQDTFLKFQEKIKNDKEKLRLENVKDVEFSNRKKLLSVIEQNAEKNKTAENNMVGFRETWNETNKTIFDESNIICPTCGQDYPAEKAQEIRETFNINKSKELTGINKRGKELAAEVAERKKDSEVFEADIATYDINTKALTEKIKSLDSGVEKTDNLQKEKLERDIEKIKADIEGLRSGNVESLEKAQADIDIVTERLENIASKKSEIETWQKGLFRINELKEQQKVCAAEFEKLEEKLFIMENFIRAKVAFLETKVNDKFKLTRFKLFDIQVNGGLSECCEVTYKGVPWNNGLNNGAKINVGMDIINTLSLFYGLTMPVFVDNAESVTDIIDSESQVIKLIVDENFKQLEVKKEGSNA